MRAFGRQIILSRFLVNLVFEIKIKLDVTNEKETIFDLVWVLLALWRRHFQLLYAGCSAGCWLAWEHSTRSMCTATRSEQGGCEIRLNPAVQAARASVGFVGLRFMHARSSFGVLCGKQRKSTTQKIPVVTFLLYLIRGCAGSLPPQEVQPSVHNVYGCTGKQT